MAGLNRRDFLKALGITSGASVVSACGFDQNYYRSPIEEIIPYVVRPEQVIPGNPVFFATTATTGPHAHPVLARHRDGRVINVGANFQAPFTPSVPKGALFELQRHYSPDRLKTPLIDGAEAKWDDAVAKLADAIKTAKAAGKKVAYLGSYRSGAIVELIREITAGEAVFFEPLGREAEAKAAELLFGRRFLPAYDLSKAHYVLSFGADFLTTWGGPSTESQYADARNPNKGNFVARFALVSAFRDQTGANADDWFAAIPGTEANVALAIAKLVAEKVGYAGPFTATLASVDVEGSAKAAGLTGENLASIAAQFAAGPAVALPGGVIGASKAATDLALAVYVLNIVSGQAGVTFGDGPVYAGPMDDMARVERLLADLTAGSVGVLLVDDHANPLYALPANAAVAEALAKADLIVSLSSHPDETSANAKLVLPVSSPLEDWGDEEPVAGLYLLRQPTMTALNGNLALGDVLLVAGRAAGLAPAVPQGSQDPLVPAAVVASTTLGLTPKTWLEYVKARWERDVYPVAGGGATFAAFWDTSLGHGFVDVRPAIVAPTVTGTVSAAAVGAFDGAGDMFLIAYPHPFLIDGRYANEPWAQESPDPMTGMVWDSWVQISPAAAKNLGLVDNDLVEITTAAGSLQLGVEVYPSLRDDTIAIAFGNGHTSFGRYANDIGQNVVKLLTVAKDGAGALAWQSSKASVKALGSKATLVSTFGGDTDERRSIGAVADATHLAEVGDAPAEHPGSLTGLHYLEVDERLQKAGITDFYGLPQHPTYRFGMVVDVNACNGCGVCAIACYAENNLPVVGKTNVKEGREMAWLRIARYQPDGVENGVEDIRFVPMMCQQCGHAPCESVCPVLATYHTIDGLNAMIYNRCVGTRYCANNCPYGARRFNWHSYVWPEPFNLQLNPEVSTRTMGVMEKCTFCVQRIRTVKSWYRNQGFTTTVPDEALAQLPACAEACPSQALTFGNLNDEASAPQATRKSARTYELFADLHTFPAVNYLAKASFHAPVIHHAGAAAAEGEGHGAAEGHGDSHGAEGAEHH